MITNERPHCPYCGSANVVAEGTVEWVVSTQEWRLRDVYDGGLCADCEEDVKRFDWRPVARCRKKAK